MDKQQMPMGNTHTVFWRDDMVTILFQSALPLIVEHGLLNNDLLQALDLPMQLEKLNRFLREKRVPVTLHFLDESDNSDPMKSAPQRHAFDSVGLPDGFLQLHAGVYPFSPTTPDETPFGFIRTSFVSFFQIKQRSSPGGSGSASTGNLVPRIVRTLNKNLATLNRDGQIPITIAMPTWLSGGTPSGGTQGCPLSPPIPVEDSCSNWHIKLTHLSSDLKSKKGDGVTVFILDSFPEQGVIERAARDAGDDNLLLRKVNETVTFDYSFMSGIQDVQEIGETIGTFVGKDVYGRHYPIRLEDHGLFIAGIVRDVAPHARIECIRVLDDLCVGDVQLLAHALWRIYLRKALLSGDLYGKPVVVNLSLVIPTDDEAKSGGVNTKIGGSNNVWASLKQPLQSLSDLGVIIVASAGNEGDVRESPGTNRPLALKPAAYAYAPYSVDGIIPVGAVNKKGKPASYSCYPGLLGVATYGGEVPKVTLPEAPGSNPTLDTPLDAPRGIYSSVVFPPLSSDPPDQYYTAPNDHAWAYWMGTSFATPIISALAARVLELQAQGNLPGNVRQAILNAAPDTTQWDRLDGTGGNPVPGKMLKAVQRCRVEDRDDEDDEEEDEAHVQVEITEIDITVNEVNL